MGGPPMGGGPGGGPPMYCDNVQKRRAEDVGGKLLQALGCSGGGGIHAVRGSGFRTRHAPLEPSPNLLTPGGGPLMPVCPTPAKSAWKR